MSRTTRHRFAALAVGVAAAAFLVGCGNGVEVGGPVPDTSPQGSPTGASGGAAGSADPGSATPSAPTTTHSAGRTKSPTGPATSGKPSASAKTPSSGKPSKPADDSSSAPSNGGGNSGSGTKSATCALGDLDVTVATPPGAGGAGSQYVLLGFTNKSSDACTLYGYPGVSFVGHHNGTQLGKPAVRDRSQSPHTVRLAPGAKESGLLQIAQAANFDPEQCQPTTSDGFRVYPPGSYTAAYVPFKASACQGKVAQLTVYPVGSRS